MHMHRQRRDALAIACGAGQLDTAQLLAGYGAIPRRPPTYLQPGTARRHQARAGKRPPSAAPSAAPAAPAAGSAEVARWLSSCRLWCRPLHYVEGMPAHRAYRLLREGGHLHSRLEDGAPSPLEVAQARTAACPTCWLAACCLLLAC